MTMTNAEWCIQHGIKFKNLSCKSCDDRHESIGYYDIDGIFHECYKGKMLGDLVVESILTWLDMDHVEPILDDTEKRYLKGVIRPFRDRVWYIMKSFSADKASCYIFIRFNDGSNDMEFPVLRKSDMYKGMKICKAYTLEVLGL